MGHPPRRRQRWDTARSGLAGLSWHPLSRNTDAHDRPDARAQPCSRPIAAAAVADPPCRPEMASPAEPRPRPRGASDPGVRWCSAVDDGCRWISPPSSDWNGRVRRLAGRKRGDRWRPFRPISMGLARRHSSPRPPPPQSADVGGLASSSSTCMITAPRSASDVQFTNQIKPLRSLSESSILRRSAFSRQRRRAERFNLHAQLATEVIHRLASTQHRAGRNAHACASPSNSWPSAQWIVGERLPGPGKASGRGKLAIVYSPAA